MAPEPVQPVFFYDLGSPACYLVAERILSELPEVPEFEPVHALALAEGGAEAVNREAINRQAQAAQLQPLRWPERWPPDTELVMLAATFAKRVGRAVAFSLAAFRQAFAGGRDLGQETTILIAAAACEMHPTAVLKGIQTRAVTGALRIAGERARAAGARRVPAIAVGDLLLDGADCVERAAEALARPVR